MKALKKHLPHDTVIEAGSVVLGIMDDTAVQHFAQANGAAETITFEIIEE